MVLPRHNAPHNPPCIECLIFFVLSRLTRLLSSSKPDFVFTSNQTWRRWEGAEGQGRPWCGGGEGRGSLQRSEGGDAAVYAVARVPGLREARGCTMGVPRVYRSVEWHSRKSVVCCESQYCVWHQLSVGIILTHPEVGAISLQAADEAEVTGVWRETRGAGRTASGITWQ